MVSAVVPVVAEFPPKEIPIASVVAELSAMLARLSVLSSTAYYCRLTDCDERRTRMLAGLLDASVKVLSGATNWAETYAAEAVLKIRQSRPIQDGPEVAAADAELDRRKGEKAVQS